MSVGDNQMSFRAFGMDDCHAFLKLRSVLPFVSREAMQAEANVNGQGAPTGGCVQFFLGETAKSSDHAAANISQAAPDFSQGSGGRSVGIVSEMATWGGEFWLLKIFY